MAKNVKLIISCISERKHFANNLKTILKIHNHSPPGYHCPAGPSLSLKPEAAGKCYSNHLI